jgi:hypothetical protein
LQFAAIAVCRRNCHIAHEEAREGAACRSLRRNLGPPPVSLKRKAAPGYCFKRLSRIGAAASRKGRIREP